MSICLTASQKDSYEFIQEYYKKNGVLPTMSEVAADAGCTVPGIAYRVAAAFLKGAYGHNVSSNKHVITEPMTQIVAPAVKFEDIFESYCDREYLKRAIFNCLSYAYDYTPRELFEGRKNGPWGGPITTCMKSALEEDRNARKDAAFLALDCIDELVAEGKIEHYRGNPSEPREERWHKRVWFTFDHKTKEEHEAYVEEKNRLEEEARLEAERVAAEEAAKQNEKNAVLAKAFTELLANPAISKVIAEMTGISG